MGGEKKREKKRTCIDPGFKVGMALVDREKTGGKRPIVELVRTSYGKEILSV